MDIILLSRFLIAVIEITDALSIVWELTLAKISYYNHTATQQLLLQSGVYSWQPAYIELPYD